MTNFTYGIQDEGDNSKQRKEEEPSRDNIFLTRIEVIRQDQSKPRVIERFLVKFSNATKNIDEVPCRVINTIVCHLLLGRPWESHQDSYYSSTNNTHSFFIRHKKAILDFSDFTGHLFGFFWPPTEPS